MSSLLEQAIVDAKALKEAALKNAESAIIEKYAPEIKKAMTTLLEQPDLGAEAALGAAAGAGQDVDLGLDVPPAALEGENACPCPDEGEATEIEIDLADLKKMAEELPVDEPMDLGPLAGTEEEGELDLGLEEEIEIDEDLLGLFEYATAAKEESKEDKEGKDKDDAEEQNEEIDLDDLDLSDLIEELVVDMQPQKGGWAGTPQAQLDYAEEVEVARRQSTQYKEEKEEFEKAVEDLQEEKKVLKQHMNELKQALMQMKDELENVNLSNARLLYTNRALRSVSLNERQKNKIVDAISKAGSIDEAKVIYETLQSTVGSTNSRRNPQSLSEAVSRPSSIIPKRKPQQNTDDLFVDRMKRLAGIKN
jgi:hypothetical protein